MASGDDIRLSVIMPVFSAQASLEQAAQSVLRQTFRDFELILINDCSPDSSGSICDRLAETDERVSVIHLSENGGASNARNEGMAKASGKYVYFMDSDDTIDRDLFETVFDSLDKNPAKAVVFGLIEEYYDQSGKMQYTKSISHPKMLIGNKKDLRKEVIRLEQSTLYGYLWNKFYDFDHIKDIGLKFEQFALNEDFFFNVKFFMDIDSVNILDITPYHYAKRIDNSLTGRFVPEYFELHERRVQVLLDQYRYWDCCTDDIMKALAAIYVRYVMSALQRNCDKRARMTRRDRKEWLLRLYDSSLFSELLPFMQSENRLVSILSGMLKKKRAGLCLMTGRVIYIVKNRLPILFAKAKQNK